MPSGGARVNAGRKRKFGEASKMRRIPASWTSSDMTSAVKAREIVNELKVLVETWQQATETPTTFDKGLELITELKGLLSTVP